MNAIIQEKGLTHASYAEKVLLSQEISVDMKEHIPGRSPLRASYVVRVLVRQKISVLMREYIQERNLLTVACVARALGTKEI